MPAAAAGGLPPGLAPPCLQRSPSGGLSLEERASSFIYRRALQASSGKVVSGHEALATTPSRTGFVRRAGPGGAVTWVTVKQDQEEKKEFAPDATASSSRADLRQSAALNFEDKARWFRGQIEKLRIPWEKGKVELQVSRDSLLRSTFEEFERLKPDDFRKTFRVKFRGEDALDAGGVWREMLELVSKQLFAVDFGLFVFQNGLPGQDTAGAQFYSINPSSGLVAGEEHLDWFRFAGRLLGKALFEGTLVKAHLSLPLYKHLLGLPIKGDDLRFEDNELWTRVKFVRENTIDGVLYESFTVNTGFGLVHELVPGGKDVELSDLNKAEWCSRAIRFRLIDSIEPQLRAFLHGFEDVIPGNNLSVFDFQELELLTCGLPFIEIEDWRKHTVYKGGVFSDRHPVVVWFWEAIEGLTPTQHGKLLQFTTGTSSVPMKGFQSLMSYDGKAQLFTIEHTGGLFPKAHTCFNRLSLPLYASKDDLIKYLLLAINLELRLDLE